MIGPKLSTLAAVGRFLQYKVEAEAKMLEKFDKARAEDQLPYFMHWNAIELHGVIRQAQEAKKYLIYVNGEAMRDDVILTDDQKLEIIREQIKRHVIDMGDVRISSRSTSVGANLGEDFDRAFVLEFFAALNSGY